jgi:hypothetical protein
VLSVGSFAVRQDTVIRIATILAPVISFTTIHIIMIFVTRIPAVTIFLAIIVVAIILVTIIIIVIIFVFIIWETPKVQRIAAKKVSLCPEGSEEGNETPPITRGCYSVGGLCFL